MPFDKKFHHVYSKAIQPAVKESGLTCSRIDESLTVSIIMDEIWKYIQESGIIIADLTNKNANVFYELGLAHSLRKDAILLSQDISDVPFDLTHWRVILYKNSKVGLVVLKDKLKSILTSSNEHFELRRKNSFYTPRKSRECFKTLSYNCQMTLSGPRGNKTKIKEIYQLKPLLSGPYEKSYTFIKEAELSEISTNIGTLYLHYRNNEREQYLVFLNSEELKNIPIILQFDVTIKNMFPLKREYWTKHLAIQIPKLHYQFSFLKGCFVEEMIVIQKKNFSDKGKILKHKIFEDLDKQMFSWSGHIPKDQFIEFHWLWRE